MSSNPGKGCKCTEHDNWCDGKSVNQVYYIEKCKKIKSSVLNYIKLHSFLPPRANYLCDVCVKVCEDQMGKSNTRKMDSKYLCICISNLIEALTNCSKKDEN